MSWRNSHLEYDWFHRALPRNIELGAGVYIESSYIFAAFFSELQPGLVMDQGSGAYDLTTIATGPAGQIRIGAFTCLNSSNVMCEESISIGAHCLFAWGTAITDTMLPRPGALESRRLALAEMAKDPVRRLRPTAPIAPVVIEDNVWVGFDSVICGGVTIGRGSVVGCKSVITKDVAPYSVVVGNPSRVLRYLNPDDTAEARANALHTFGFPSGAIDRTREIP